MELVLDARDGANQSCGRDAESSAAGRNCDPNVRLRLRKRFILTVDCLLARSSGTIPV